MATNIRDNISEPLHRCAIHLLRQLSAVDEQSGLSRARLSALSVIVFAGPLTLGELAKAEQVSAPTMSKLVQALKDDGLVTFKPSPLDSRQKIIQANKKGKSVMLKARDARLSLLDKKLQSLPKTQQQILQKAVVCLEQALATV